MNITRLVALILSVLAMAVTGSGGARAQYLNPVGEMIQPQVVDIPFPFQVGDADVGTQKTFPAGKYDVEQPSQDRLVFRSAKGVAFEVPVMTRLAKPSTPLAKANVVFDKLGDNYYISEIWVPGADGFVVGFTKQLHTHKTVKATKKR